MQGVFQTNMSSVANSSIFCRRISWTPPSKPNGVLESYVVAMSPGGREWMVAADQNSIAVDHEFVPGTEYTFTVSPTVPRLTRLDFESLIYCFTPGDGHQQRVPRSGLHRLSDRLQRARLGGRRHRPEDGGRARRELCHRALGRRQEAAQDQRHDQVHLLSRVVRRRPRGRRPQAHHHRTEVVNCVVMKTKYVYLLLLWISRFLAVPTRPTL